MLLGKGGLKQDIIDVDDQKVIQHVRIYTAYETLKAQRAVRSPIRHDQIFQLSLTGDER